jgi:hypothetical protein
LDGLASAPDIAFIEVEIVNVENADRVEATATVTSHKRRDIALEYIIGRLSQASGGFVRRLANPDAFRLARSEPFTRRANGRRSRPIRILKPPSVEPPRVFGADPRL